MCGIFGYVGKNKCKKMVLEGLSRLEYRGYDSAGFVCIDQNHKHLSFLKEVGSVSALQESLATDTHDGVIGLGHTRWATHGAASKKNAHPHLNSTNSIAVVHNGIIEGHSELRERLLEEGYEFRSSTDTEVAVHLLESTLQCHDLLKDAAVDLVTQLTGIYAFVFVLEEYPNQLLLIRNKSPLAIGIGEDEMFVASDPMAFADKTNKVLFMPDESFALLRPDGIELYSFAGKPLRVKTQTLDFTFTAANKQGFEHYMIKEIYEQKKAIDHTIAFYKKIGNHSSMAQCECAACSIDAIWSHLGMCSDTNQIKKIQDLQNVSLVAAGTSWHASRIGQFFFETICNIPTNVYLASEFRYKKFFPKDNSVFIMVSQSGETADTLGCLRHVTEHKIPTIALTNVASSTMVRESDGFLLMQAGPEISVASTKAFTSQLASLYWLANRIALSRGDITDKNMKAAEEQLFIAAEALESCIENYKWEIVNRLAPKYAQYDRFIFLGRNISYPFALEAALKLKEISYIFAQAYPAGELKHGPIALIDNKTPIVVFSLLDDLVYQKLVANVQEVKARHGHVVAFAFEGQRELIELADEAFVIPRVAPLLAPIAMAGLMQFFVYNISKELGTPIDKPRNLAKSVTVE